jgi:Rieske Fe-S protein
MFTVDVISWLAKGRIRSHIREGLKKVAVYRDEQGQCHRFSAVCPHLGCVVAWNSLEKTWDCPCHGSRFTSLGRVVNGPANTDLTAP